MATRVSEFTKAEIPERTRGVGRNDGQTLDCFILNCAIETSEEWEEYPQWFNFLRRADVTFNEYNAARNATLTYLAQNNKDAVPLYLSALQHWEYFLGATWHALELLRPIVQNEEKWFERGDQSTAEHLNNVYNQSKHVESRIEHGQMPETGPLPVWLCNSGLRSTDTELTFDEAAEVLDELMEWAYVLERPIESKERLNAWVERQQRGGSTT